MKKKHEQRKGKRGRGGRGAFVCASNYFALLFAPKSKSFFYDCEILSKKMNYIDNNEWKEGSNILCNPQETPCVFSAYSYNK